MQNVIPMPRTEFQATRLELLESIARLRSEIDNMDLATALVTWNQCRELEASMRKVADYAGERVDALAWRGRA